ncbi:MAG: hypothetical protein GXO78_10825 [Calditrichaeota bacterium]|nr:hypothetical protein [Calditrichota bacterium]
MRKKLLTYLLIYFTFFFWKCTNPFSVRTPEPPILTGGKQLSKNLQNNPDSLLAKLQYAFLQKNVTYYEECLADSQEVGKNFVFIPEKNESFRFSNWSRQDEINYFTNLINQNDLERIEISFYDQTEWNAAPTSADTLYTQFAYRINLVFRKQVESYQGRAVMKILRSSLSQWYIFHWEDFHSGRDEQDTWSTLKANYRYN